MDKNYADTVRLLLDITPTVFANDIFGMKGGTAINLFLQNMPRLSVDIDVVYLPLETTRDEALKDIQKELSAIASRIKSLGLQTRLIGNRDLGDTKLIVDNESSQVKIEVNVVFRGTVLPIERQPLTQIASDLFGTEIVAPILARDEVYAGKIVAALDRQHPRDLFDVWRLYASGGLSHTMIECFVIYLAGHNRPPHEVLFGNDKNIEADYEQAFVGMTDLPCPLETLLDARSQLRLDLCNHLTEKHRCFLAGLVQAEPDWSLLECNHAAQLPALRWKLANLKAFRKSRPADFRAQANTMMTSLDAL
jgi:predicted nucleotidyltransferase component of viral defense system